ncbi:MAG: hypothetical protein D6769_00835 [Methanobacteriota archaeon]|nr:MAG: hypothetical protein D6769_00835 [Euryarchaeota archaeon]
MTFFVMMLATIIAHFHLYKIAMDNIKERWELKELLIKSFDTIARNETTSGDECIIRYYGEKEVICRESN